MLNDQFCEFFARNGFLIDISLDGPRFLHDAYRKDKRCEGSFDKTMKGLALLKKHGVDFNILTTINAINAKHPSEVYAFLREHTNFMQFLPVVEGLASTPESEEGQRFAMPQGINTAFYKRKMTSFSVDALDFGNFLCVIIDEWKKMITGKSTSIVLKRP